MELKQVKSGKGRTFPGGDSKADDIFSCVSGLSEESKKDILGKTAALIDECILVQLKHAIGTVQNYKKAWRSNKELREVGFESLSYSVGANIRKGLVASFMFNFIRCLGYTANEADKMIEEYSSVSKYTPMMFVTVDSPENKDGNTESRT